jgi:hypothetical protein
MAINQGPGKGSYEDRVLQQGGGVNSTPLGNKVARNVGPGGPGVGRTVYGSGTQTVNNGSLRPTPKPSPPATVTPGPARRIDGQ